MMKQYVFAGFGGQGMLLIGKFLAMANMLEGKHVSWLPSYGPEMRGGTANCSVVVSDEPVGSPMVDNCDVLIAMNLPSLDKFEHTVKPGGLIVVNSSIIDRKVQRDDVRVVYCDAAGIADAVKNPKGANVAILGAMAQDALPRGKQGSSRCRHGRGKGLILSLYILFRQQWHGLRTVPLCFFVCCRGKRACQR